MSRSPSPWLYIPTLYFASGVPYIIINTVSVIFYKKLGVDNTQIAVWTSLLYLPWVIKMFWGPIVDTYSTKRTWILYTQLAMFCCLGLIAFCLQLPNFFFISLAALTVGAFISATYDIATDGFYLLALSPEQQAFFVGIRSLFYRLAVIFGSGLLVVLAGQLEGYLNNIPLSWTLAIGFSAVVLAILCIFHRFSLPLPDADKPRQLQNTDKIPFWTIISSYFAQEKIPVILAFILLYRFGEAMLVKFASLFLLDKPEVGGLGLSTSDVGLVYGTFGVISLIAGGILGGLVIAKYGLKRCLFPMALALNLPDLFYVYMAYHQPSLNLVYPLVSLEQFGYGFGFTAFSVYLMYISQGEYKTSHFAISTGIMALGMMLPGIVSGYLQPLLGYPLFFSLVCLLTIPGMIVLFFLPLKAEAQKKSPAH
ncbi:AmpG family muropeptide MFS transporter [Nostoc sp. LEGE 06077]|uniref:AmpG family muropeptide MFS transporter n=1 Tax=Nostoc sp. LEGE 06077 TaxID=915325 RepID=UPI00187F7098|nr:AmpG family muropeptide MFS transporter [Nostoc sp. LEGE 06077]MBE9209516.1 AmpG family muropeptide MFS transporter [Nostoc sp. LEGE 06077]